MLAGQHKPGRLKLNKLEVVLTLNHQYRFVDCSYMLVPGMISYSRIYANELQTYQVCISWSLSVSVTAGIYKLSVARFSGHIGPEHSELWSSILILIRHTMGNVSYWPIYQSGNGTCVLSQYKSVSHVMRYPYGLS